MSSPTAGNHVYATIDEHFQRYLDEHPELHERWLLAQTLYSGQSRRVAVGMLPIPDGAHVLDVGTGFGAIALDIAAMANAFVVGIDVDESVLTVARAIHQGVKAEGVLAPGSGIEFRRGDVYGLPFENASFDLVIARYVYQHLKDPIVATREIARVLKPGGHVCLMDIDDQLTITHPESQGCFATLQRAFRELQEARGGDRFVGRKLTGYMQEAGLGVVGVVIQPEAQYMAANANDVGLLLTLLRLQEVRHEMISRGVLTNETFEACFAGLQSEVGTWQFHANGQMIALGRK